MTTSARNDVRLVDDVALTVAMYVDEHGLTLSEGVQLAEDLANRLADDADSRREYLPSELVDD